jgi:hypothetical protein
MSCQQEHIKLTCKFCPECGIEIPTQPIMTDEEHILNVMNTMYEKFAKMTERNHKDERELLGLTDEKQPINKKQLYNDFIKFIEKKHINTQQENIYAHIILVNNKFELFDKYTTNLKKILNDQGYDITNLKLSYNQHQITMISDNKLYQIIIKNEGDTIDKYKNNCVIDEIMEKLKTKYHHYYNEYNCHSHFARDVKLMLERLIIENNIELKDDIAKAISKLIIKSDYKCS